MPRSITERDIERVRKTLIKMGKDAMPILEKVADAAANFLANHAKGKHFFVGVGKGSSAKAEANELTFKNPDGSPRFKVRTQNLVNSIQVGHTIRKKDSVEVSVIAGMKYAKDVEEGGPGRQAFPFMQPALEVTKPFFGKRMVQEFRAFIKRRRV